LRVFGYPKVGLAKLIIATSESAIKALETGIDAGVTRRKWAQDRRPHHPAVSPSPRQLHRWRQEHSRPAPWPWSSMAAVKLPGWWSGWSGIWATPLLPLRLGSLPL